MSKGGGSSGAGQSWKAARPTGATDMSTGCKECREKAGIHVTVKRSTNEDVTTGITAVIKGGPKNETKSRPVQKGSAIFKGLDPGRWEVKITLDDKDTEYTIVTRQPQRCAILKGQMGLAPFVADPDGWIEFIVQEETTKTPLKDVELMVAGPDGKEKDPKPKTDANGKVRLEKLSKGNWKLIGVAPAENREAAGEPTVQA